VIRGANIKAHEVSRTRKEENETYQRRMAGPYRPIHVFLSGEKQTGCPAKGGMTGRGAALSP